MSLIKIDAEKLANFTIDRYRAAIDQHIINIAKSRGYDSPESIYSYVSSAVPEWSAEAIAFIAWRDAVWSYTFQKLEDIKQGSAQTPASVEEFISNLPEINWDSGEQ